MLRLAFDFIITWRETRTRPNAYLLPGLIYRFTIVMKLFHCKHSASCVFFSPLFLPTFVASL